MLAVRVVITRFVSADQPGWVECCLTDAWYASWTIVEKVPVVTNEPLDAESVYPQPGLIACQFISQFCDDMGRRVVTINTREPWGVESSDGTTQFEVLPDHLTEI